MEGLLDSVIPLWLGILILSGIFALLFAWPVISQIVTRRKKGLVKEMKAERKSASKRVCEVVCQTHHVKVTWDALDGCAVGERKLP